MASDSIDSRSVVVVGAGLAGLSAAALLAREGRAVTLLERSPVVGGRALTREEHGFHLNLGPHALYRTGAGMRVLRSLGIEPRGGVPRPSGGHAVKAGVAHTLPAGPVSLLTTGLMGIGAKLELGRFLGGVSRLDAAPLDRVVVADWLRRAIRHDDARAAVAALVRLTTYTSAPEVLSAGTALRQLQLGLGGNVLYVDGGWQTMVEALHAAAAAAGARIVAGARAARVASTAGGFTVATDGATYDAAQVVLALAPGEAAALVDGPAAAALRAWGEAATPVRAACLDVALARLPRPRSTFALGIDRPLYFSVHSAVARLAPAGGAVVHVARYLPVGAEEEPRAAERELEGLLDLLQPGWREAVVARRFLPRLVVMNALATAAAGGTAGRPGPGVPGAPGLWVAGDWVGSEGLLADASLASAARVAALVQAAGPSSATRAA